MSIKDIKKALSRTFQGVLKNIVSLANDSTLESDLKPLKVGQKSTPLEISESELKVNGTINAEAINVNGSAVQTGTDAGATELNELSDVTYSSGDLTISSLDTIISGDLTLDSSGDITLDAAGGDVNVLQADVRITSTKKLYFDGTSPGTTYIENDGRDRLNITCGGDTILLMKEASTGNFADFGTTGVGFTQFEPTYNVTDTNVNFNDNGNKGFLTFGSGNITDLNLYFPNVSCNCTLLVKQDGSGSRTITNYKTFDQADGNESAVVWAGGSAPTLTTTANKLDILSFYWDNDNHTAYGVASLNF